MIGVVKSIPTKDNRQANYCFIKGDDGKEYFLHISELRDGWDKLKSTIALKREAIIDFQTENGLKGLRAAKASIVNI